MLGRLHFGAGILHTIQNVMNGRTSLAGENTIQDFYFVKYAHFYVDEYL
jgi:hypothetical protein